MDNQTPQQRLDQLKDKYYQSITELEEQQQLSELFQKSLSRLALVAHGIDPTLDAQLDALRASIRQKSADRHNLESILEQIENTIIRLENNQVHAKTPGVILAELLDSLALPKSQLKEAKQLAKQFKETGQSALDPLLEQLVKLLGQVLQTNDDNANSKGFSLNPFKSNRKTIQDNAETTDLTGDEQQTRQEQEPTPKRPPTHMLLMQLLERLSLPAELSERTTKIRLLIEAGIEEQDLPKLIDDIADIISALGSRVLAEKHEYETFLKSLTARLNELDEQIHLGTDEDSKAFLDRSNIGEAVEQEVKGLISHVNIADNLEQLKLTVSQRLDFLNQHFDDYRQSDQLHFEQSQKQIQALKQRIHLMEQESIELRQSAMRSRDQALKDPLTGIWNRQALNEVLDKEYARWQRYQKPLSIILWDIDFFKRINDKYGHAAGDKVLKTIAHIFTSQTRDADFVARYGGEEFMGIFPETTLDNALNLANKIREKIERAKFHYKGETVSITASAGLACFKDADTIEVVFSRADEALYKAKEQGRNRCLVFE